MTRRLFAALFALMVVAAACGGNDVVEETTTQPAADTTAPATDTTGAPDTTLPELSGGGIDLSLTRDDVDCTPEGFSDDEITETVVAHYVVEGNLGAVCYGTENEVLVENWEVLADIVPGGQLHDLVVFTGFESLEDGDDVTLAFVISLDDGSSFQMSVNLDESQADPDESRLTMVHEFGHVFTGNVTQIDRLAIPEECDTYWNGEGCFYEDSLIYMWIEDFWPDYIDDIDPDAAPSPSDGEERCNIDPSFLGAYAASNPEEDFAETFSAYVLRLTPDTPELEEKYDWLDSFAGLAEFKERAIDAGYGPQDNNFEVCG